MFRSRLTKVMRYLKACLLLLSFWKSATAQTGPAACGTHVQLDAEHRNEIQQLIANSAHLRGGGTVYTIPVVFHILHLRGKENIAPAQVLDALSILNRDFRKLNADTIDVLPAFQGIIADMNIEFVLATKDPEGNCTTGIVRYQDAETLRGEATSKLDPWPRSQYLNIWVVDRILNGSAGYFTQSPAAQDGVMILQEYVGSIGTSALSRSRALVHEVGHYLGLDHLYGSNTPPEECGDEGISDTPITQGHDYCPDPEDSQVCTPAVYENYENYMEGIFTCKRMFTIGQRDWVHAALLSTAYERDQLHTEGNLQASGVAPGYEASCPPEADFYAQVGSTPSNPSIPFPAMSCVNTPVRFFDNSARAFPTSWSWTFQDGTPATSTEQHPTVQFSTPGYKTVTLTVANDQGSSSKTDVYAVHIGSPDVAVTPYYESFEGMEGENLYPYVAINYEANHTRFGRFEGGGATGQACAMLNSADRDLSDFVDPDNIGDYDDLVTPLLNLSGASSAALSFRYAYSTTTTVWSDVTEFLEVQSSTYCGGSIWLTRATIFANELVNNGTSTDVPLGEWATRTLNLPASVLSEKVRFRFRFVSSAYAGNLYIDDLWIGVPVGMDELSNEGFITIFPNPANDHFSLQVTGMESSVTEIIITDIRGAVAHRSMMQPNGDAAIQLSANAMGLAAGLYVLRASNALGSSNRKLIIGR